MLPARGRGDQFGGLIASISTLVFFGVIAFAVVRSPGWDEVKQQFFDGEQFRTTFPAILDAFGTTVKIFLIAEALVLVLGLLIALIRMTRTPVLFPIRFSAIVYTDVMRGIPMLLLVYLLLVPPFFFVATALCLTFARFGGEVHRIYSFDALGAGLGSLGILAALFLLLPSDALRLIGYGADPNNQLRPGGALVVTLYWQPQQKLDADFTGFVQLLAASGDKVAQGNDHPAGGAYYPTSLWRPGELLRDVFTVTLPSSLQPGAYTILAGMYRTHEVTGAVQEMAPPLTLGKIGMLPDVARPATDPERPLNVELGDRILLLGYSLRRSDTALEVILQWHATRYVDTDYTVFVHLLDRRGNIVAQHDGEPAEGLASTSIWVPGQAIRDEHRLLLPSDMAPGTYTLVCGMYDQTTRERLIITDGPVSQQGESLFLQEVTFLARRE